LQFIDPGKPIQNACSEHFNSGVRDEGLNTYWFAGVADAKLSSSKPGGWNTISDFPKVRLVTKRKWRCTRGFLDHSTSLSWPDAHNERIIVQRQVMVPCSIFNFIDMEADRGAGSV
jgi:hypothetical protein